MTNLQFLKQKQSLMSLVDCVFRKQSADTKIPFAEIAAITRLPLLEVNHLLFHPFFYHLCPFLG